MKSPELRRRAELVAGFRQSVVACNIMNVPTMLKSVLKDEAWRLWIEPAGIVREHKTFYSFITTPPMAGCGFDPKVVAALLDKAGDDDAKTMWARAISAYKNQQRDGQDREAQRPHGGDRSKVDTPKSDVNLARPDGNSAATALRRLRKDRPDIHQRVLTGELSPHAGMIAAGLRKPRASRRKSAVDRIWGAVQRLTADDRAELRRRLDAMGKV